MNVLDENIPAGQRQLLVSWRIRIRQIGFDIGRRGMQDDEIIAFLLRMRHPTFFTRDDDFYARRLCHARYCLVQLAVGRDEVALFVRRLLQHPAFVTQAKRSGLVMPVSAAKVSYWRLHSDAEELIEWP